MSALKKYQQRYRTALYTYFRITNLRESYTQFIATHEPPVFTYRSSLNISMIERRLAHLQADYKTAIANGDEPSKLFLRYRLKETEALHVFLKIKEQTSQGPVAELTRYYALQEDLYGAPSAELFEGIGHLLGQRMQALPSSIRPKLPLQLPTAPRPLPRPSSEVFSYYQGLHRTCFPALYKVLMEVTPGELRTKAGREAPFVKALAAIMPENHGWTVETVDHGSGAFVSKHQKKVVISSLWRPSSLLRFRQVIAHEIGGHVQRAIHEHTEDEFISVSNEEEGLAILMEQLLGKKFIFKRSIRYLAVCAALGLDGEERDFGKTYDLLNIALSLFGYSPDYARKRAFYETARIFRGGLPAVPGAAYIKDKIYLESNLKVWEQLSTVRLSTEEFRTIFNHAPFSHSVTKE